jgi:hypothetical protein
MNHLGYAHLCRGVHAVQPAGNGSHDEIGENRLEAGGLIWGNVAVGPVCGHGAVPSTRNSASSSRLVPLQNSATPQKVYSNGRADQFQENLGAVWSVVVAELMRGEFEQEGRRDNAMAHV